MTERREGKHILDLVKRYAPPPYDYSTDDMTVVFAIELAEKDRQLAEMRAALEPFAAFAEKAEAFVAARAKDGKSPIMPSSDFRLADFHRAKAALSAAGERGGA